MTIQGVEGKEAIGDNAQGSTSSRRKAEVRSPREKGVKLVKGDVLKEGGRDERYAGPRVP